MLIIKMIMAGEEIATSREFYTPFLSTDAMLPRKSHSGLTSQVFLDCDKRLYNFYILKGLRRNLQVF